MQTDRSVTFLIYLSGSRLCATPADTAAPSTHVRYRKSGTTIFDKLIWQPARQYLVLQALDSIDQIDLLILGGFLRSIYYIYL